MKTLKKWSLLSCICISQLYYCITPFTFFSIVPCDDNAIGQAPLIYSWWHHITIFTFSWLCLDPLSLHVPHNYAQNSLKFKEIKPYINCHIKSFSRASSVSTYSFPFHNVVPAYLSCTTKDILDVKLIQNKIMFHCEWNSYLDLKADGS